MLCAESRKRTLRHINRSKNTHGVKPSEILSLEEKKAKRGTIARAKTRAMESHNSNVNDESTDKWTFPLLKMDEMTQDRYNALLAMAKDPNRPQRCAAIISGFTCIGKTTFGTKWRPKYDRHRVINLEYNQYVQDSGGNGTKEVDHEAYLQDTLIAAKLIPDAIVVVNCHTSVRQTMHEYGLKYVRVHPDFHDQNVKDAWRARAEGRQINRDPTASKRFADRMMECWDSWSEMGTNCGFDFASTRSVVFGADDYLCTRVDDILREAYRYACPAR